jgi:hypothetical protein
MSGATGHWRQAALRAALWLLLGGWFGAWSLFAFSMAPVAFRLLPPEIAGQLVGPVIASLHLYGAAAGPGLALLALALRRGAWCVALPLLMAALCLVSHFWVTAEIEQIRDLAFGPSASQAALERFWGLHGASMGIYTAVGLLSLVLAALHAWAETSGAGAPHAFSPASNAAKNREEFAKNA